MLQMGFFEDKDVLNRSLSDWDGVWQSVEPYLRSGELDIVLQKKRRRSKIKQEQYQAYYTHKAIKPMSI